MSDQTFDSPHGAGFMNKMGLDGLKMGPGNDRDAIEQLLGTDQAKQFNEAQKDQRILGALPTEAASFIKQTRHLLDGIGTIERGVLETLGRSYPYPLRDVVGLFRHVQNNIQDTINIVQRAAAHNLGLNAIIAATAGGMASLQEQAGQPLQQAPLDFGVKASATGLVHIDINRPVQFVAMESEAAQQLAVNLLMAVAEVRNGIEISNLGEIVQALLTAPPS